MSSLGDRQYSIYGYTLSTQEELGLPRNGGSANLWYRIDKNKKPPSLSGAKLIYQADALDLRYASITMIWQRGKQYRLYFPDVGTYDITPTSITCYPCLTVLQPALQNELLGTVLSIWLEIKGIVALHSSAVVIGGRAVGFVASSGNGKSTLAASLMQASFPLLTDDVLPVAFSDNSAWAYPGYPRMRLWPEEAVYFLGHSLDLEKVHSQVSKRWVRVGTDFGSFNDTPAPLSCIYLPTRCDSGKGTRIRIERLSPRAAMIELTRYSFAANVVEALGLASKHFDLLARLAEHVSIRRITMPSGLEKLAQVRDAILSDLRFFKSSSLDFQAHM